MFMINLAKTQRKPIQRKPVNKRPANQVLPVIEEETKTKIKSGLCLHPKPIQIRAVYRTEHYAAFYNNSHDNDFFHRLLSNKCTEHKKYLGLDADAPYKTPFSNATFKYLPMKYRGGVMKLICKDKQGLICMPDTLTDKPCVFALRVLPYDIISKTGEKICGLVIKVSEIKQM